MKTKVSFWIVILLLILLLAALLNISLGSVNIPFTEVWHSIFNEDGRYLVRNYRAQKTLTAILVGSGLSLSGLMMQTMFRNPLAGPFVLGISSGASLGVALLVLGASFFGATFTELFASNYGLALASSVGAFIVLFAIMIVAQKVKNTMSILIIGLMFGSLTSAIISVLAYFSTAEQLQQFMFWTYGSLGNLSWEELFLFFIVYLIGIGLIFFIIKPFNNLLLGENYAKSMGVNIKRTRNITLISTAILTGIITAFAGPIAFVGLVVPHLAKILFKTSDHRIVFPVTAILGAIVLLISDTIAQLPNSDYTLPINAVTMLFGSPIVIWLLVRKKNIVL